MSFGGGILCRFHPKDIRFAVPTARHVNDLFESQQYTSLHPKDSRFAVPTARHVNDR